MFEKYCNFQLGLEETFVIAEFLNKKENMRIIKQTDQSKVVLHYQSLNGCFLSLLSQQDRQDTEFAERANEISK